MGPVLSGVVSGGIGGGLAVGMLVMFSGRKSCPQCDTDLPRFRKPATFREAMLGGWHCPSCGVKVSRNGKLLGD